MDAKKEVTERERERQKEREREWESERERERESLHETRIPTVIMIRP